MSEFKPEYVTKKQLAHDPALCFTEAMLSYYLLHRRRNGLDRAVRKIGRKLVIRKDLFLEWIDIFEDMSKAFFIEVFGDVLFRDLRNPPGDQRIDFARSNREILELGIGEVKFLNEKSKTASNNNKFSPWSQ